MNKLLTLVFALTVASAASTAFAQDAQAGAKKNAMCIGCHGIVGYRASFPEVYQVPKISGQSTKYIEAALTAYKEGARKHPTMRAIADSLSEKDIKDLAAFYAGHGGTPAPVPEKPAALPSEKAVKLMTAANCASCHGANFNTPLEGTPKLAGQHKDYLLIAARAYLSSDKHLVGRANAVMGGTLKAQREPAPKEFDAALKETLDYISKLPGDLQTIPESRFR